MILHKLVRYSLLGSSFAMVLLPQAVFACATCFGRSDSKLAQGMNMGILSLLAVVFFVLGGIAAFFVYLARKSATTPAASVDGGSLEASTKKILE